jgi:hypothetical protein
MNTLLKAHNGTMQNLVAVARPATMVDWLSYPDRLSMTQAAFLVGRPVAEIEEWINTGAVDAWDGADGATQVDKASLREFWELVWELDDYCLPA